MARRRTFGAVLGTVALFVAGCGGDDDEKSSTPPLTKAEYIAKADPICVDGKKKTKTYKNQLDSLPKDAEVKETVPALEGTLAATRKGAARLRALPRPTEDRVTLDAYFASLGEALVASEDLIAAAKTNDLARVEQVGTGNPELKAERKQIAKRYGFKHCA